MVCYVDPPLPKRGHRRKKGFPTIDRCQVREEIEGGFCGH